MKILLACPITNMKHKVLYPWLQHIRSIMAPQGCELDYYFVDNSEDFKGRARVNLKALGYAGEHYSDRFKVNGKYHIPQMPVGEMLGNCWNIIREKVLRENYDFHFSLECDVFAPAHALIVLLAHATIRGMQVVGFTYPLRKNMAGHLCLFFPWAYSASKHVISKPLRALQFVDGKLKQVAGMGQGCMLVHRSVYEKIEFKPGNDYGWSDAHFATDCINAGVKQYCDTSLIVEHIDA